MTEPKPSQVNDELINPPDGGYSFIEFEDLNLSEVYDIAMRYLKDVPTVDIPIPLNEILTRATTTSTSTYELVKALDEAKRLMKLYDEDIYLRYETKVENFLKATPAEQIEAERRLRHDPNFGVTIKSTLPVKKYTCGRISTVDKSFTPSKPGSMVTAFTITAPVYKHSITLGNNNKVDYFEFRVARLG